MNLVGKRYECGTCGAEVLCTRPGPGELACCDVPMQVKTAKPLPASD